MTQGQRVSGSFRDPSGFVFRHGGLLHRQVNDRYRDNYDALMNGGLYNALIARGLLVPHCEVDVVAPEPSLGSLVIRPEQVPFISYPFEWSPSQLQAAAEVTLESQRLALEHGMSMRDASAYNVQFVRGQPVLIDTLSFERRTQGTPWVAYSQFCRHFLAPLALMKRVDVRTAELLRSELDGISLDFASRLLPARTRLQWGLGLHIHAHAASQRRSVTKRGTSPQRTPRVSDASQLGLVGSLSAAVRREAWQPKRSTWRDYYARGESYTDDSMAHKDELVRSMLAGVDARMIWDLGANTGHFSRVAAEVTGAQVLAIEADVAAVEVNFRQCRESGHASVLPLVNDLANPTPRQGWSHYEWQSLADRGPADIVLALALIHHLAIGNNVPLLSILQWLATLGMNVLVEWIPKDDPMVQRLLSTREDVFQNYSTAQFEAAMETYFKVRRREKVRGSARQLFLLEKQ